MGVRTLLACGRCLPLAEGSETSAPSKQCRSASISFHITQRYRLVARRDVGAISQRRQLLVLEAASSSAACRIAEGVFFAARRAAATSASEKEAQQEAGSYGM